MGISAADEKNKYEGYKGRGLIQITFPETYIAYGKYKGMDFTGVNRTKIATPEYGMDSAAWFWTKFKAHNLNDLADKNDLIGLSAVVNGGFNHFDVGGSGGGENRKAYLLKAFQILKVSKCKVTPPTILQNLSVFELENSIVYNMIGESFGWGIWHDPNLKKIGCTKSLPEAQKGYRRFLELSKTKKMTKARYGYTFEKAKALALSRI